MDGDAWRLFFAEAVMEVLEQKAQRVIFDWESRDVRLCAAAQAF